MKKFIFISVFIFLFTHLSFSQEYSKLDSIQTGTKYKFILFDETEIIGKVISQDSVSIAVQTDKMTVILKKDDIFSVNLDLSSGKYKFIISASGGIVFLTGPYDDGPYGSLYKRGITFQTSGLYPLSDSKGIRFQFSYSRIKRDNDSQGNYYYYSTLEGGNRSFYSFKIGVAIGTFKSITRLSGYFDLNAGIHFTNTEELRTTNYNPYDSTYYTQIYSSRRSTYFVLGIGAGASYRFSRNFGAFAELEYNMISSEGFFFLWGNGYFPFRAGISYFIR